MATKATTKTNAKVSTSEPAVKETAPKEEKTMAVKNNGHSNGKRVVTLADMPKISLTKKEFEALDAKGIVDTMIDPKNTAINRIGRERAKKELVLRIKEGKIKVTEPRTLASWTYKNVVVTGADLEKPVKIKGVSKPAVTLTAAQFGKLSNEKKAEYIAEYANKRRVANDIVPELIKIGMPVSAEDVMYLTNNRVVIEGVTVPTSRTGGGGGQHTLALTEGVAFD